MRYDWLKYEDAPKHLVQAVRLMGTKEVPGLKSNPTILAWAKELRLHEIYRNDDTAWCGLFIAITLHRAGRDVLHAYGNLRAREWANYGLKVDKAELADILVFVREGGGHVGYYVAEDADCYHVLGGNQSNMVNVTRILKTRCTAIRRIPYDNKPKNIRSIVINSSAEISTNEA